MVRRWAKLEKDFLNKSGVFDISKIPDIYDCIKYDLLHNINILQLEQAEELYTYAKNLADVVIPQVNVICVDAVVVVDGTVDDVVTDAVAVLSDGVVVVAAVPFVAVDVIDAVVSYLVVPYVVSPIEIVCWRK